MDHLCNVNTDGQAGIITEPVYLLGIAVGWGFIHMAGNMSITAYADLGDCVPSNCKQMLCWTYSSSILTSKTCLFCLIVPAFPSVFLSLGRSCFVGLHPKSTAATKPRLLHSSAVKWCKYRLLWGHNVTQEVCWIAAQCMLV